MTSRRLVPKDAQQVKKVRARLVEQAALQPRDTQTEIVKKALGRASAASYVKVIEDAAYAQGALDAMTLGVAGSGESLLAMERRLKEMEHRLNQREEQHRLAMDRQTTQHRATVEGYTLRLTNKEDELRQLRLMGSAPRPPEREADPEPDPEPAAPPRTRRRITTGGTAP